MCKMIIGEEDGEDVVNFIFFSQGSQDTLREPKVLKKAYNNLQVMHNRWIFAASRLLNSWPVR